MDECVLYHLPPNIYSLTGRRGRLRSRGKRNHFPARGTPARRSRWNATLQGGEESWRALPAVATKGEGAASAPAAAMVNILGDLWADAEPDWAAALADPAVSFHLYGKSTPHPGRKMGHFTVLDSTPEQAAAIALQARKNLRPTAGVAKALG